MTCLSKPSDITFRALKGEKLCYIITRNVIWANQTTESFVYNLQRTHAMFDSRCFPAAIKIHTSFQTFCRYISNLIWDQPITQSAHYSVGEYPINLNKSEYPHNASSLHRKNSTLGFIEAVHQPHAHLCVRGCVVFCSSRSRVGRASARAPISPTTGVCSRLAFSFAAFLAESMALSSRQGTKKFSWSW